MERQEEKKINVEKEIQVCEVGELLKENKCEKRRIESGERRSISNNERLQNILPHKRVVFAIYI